MDSENVSALIISDFNAANFAGYLNNDPDGPLVHAHTAPYGQVMQTLTDFSLPCWQESPDFVIVWTQPQSVLGSFKSFLEYSRSPVDRVMEEVDAFCRLLTSVSERARAILVPTWVVSAYNRGLGMIDLKDSQGIANVLTRANLRLVDNLQAAANTYVLNAQRWMELAGAKNAYNPKLWYMGKIGFGNEVFKQAASDVKAALRGLAGQARKIILLDLDETLWGGIVGDVGWEGITLGGHDPIGEAFADFQHALKALKNRGLLLGIVSKNDESIALEAISRHPEMILRPDDFAGWRINWTDKAQNIVSLISELNLGLQSVVFIDDNPVERSRVRETLPEVLVPEWPQDRQLYKKALLELTCFDVPSITGEDAERTLMYAAERKRVAMRDEVKSFDEWLRTLDTRVIVESLNAPNLPRAAQLINKTNQMNLTTRRMTEAELLSWANQDNHRLWTFRVVDKFGDAGLTGIASIEFDHDTATVVDFVLSCRVMGRRIEETMLHQVASQAARLGIKQVRATYIPTPKNRVCQDFWKERSGFEADPGGEVFTRSLNAAYPLPDGINLVDKEDA